MGLKIHQVLQIHIFWLNLYISLILYKNKGNLKRAKQIINNWELRNKQWRILIVKGSKHLITEHNITRAMTDGNYSDFKANSEIRKMIEFRRQNTS